MKWIANIQKLVHQSTFFAIDREEGTNIIPGSFGAINPNLVLGMTFGGGIFFKTFWDS